MNIAKVFGRIIGLTAVFATLIVIAFYGLGKTRRLVHARPQEDENATTGCTLATITGNYGVLAFGGYPGSLESSVGILKLYGEDNASYNGTANNESEVIKFNRSGKYTLSSNCAGTMTLKDSVTGITYTYAMVVVSSGNQIDIMSTTVPNVVAFVANKTN